MTIRIDHLSVRLGSATVLKDVSARFQAGRMTALLGPNGAGKTTLLRAILGLVRASSGSLKLDGADINQVSLIERARRIGYLPQLAHPHWNISVRELVGLGRLPYRTSPAQNEAAITSALDATDTAQFADRPIDSLSGGERARVYLARVLAGEPEWILADEPLANLDPPHQIAVLALLKKIAADGTGIIVTLHDLSAAAHYSDDVLILKSGSVVGNAITPETLHSAYEMAFDMFERNGIPVILPRP
jgi:iron complex transport system ATP-binding protein